MENIEIQSKPRFRGYSVNTLNIYRRRPCSAAATTTTITTTTITTTTITTTTITTTTAVHLCLTVQVT